jgi:hypothetical protein
MKTVGANGKARKQLRKRRPVLVVSAGKSIGKVHAEVMAAREADRPADIESDPAPMRTPGLVVSLQGFIQNQLRAVTAPNAARDALINDLFFETSKKGIQGWAYLANCLFFAIARHHGDDVARRIFDESGPMPKRLRTALRNATLLDRYDMMKPKPNVARLAREVAKENKGLPKEQQRGAGGTSPSNLEDFIRDLLDARKKSTRRRR